MKKKILYHLIFLLFLAAACSDRMKIDYPSDPEIVGLATPIELETEVTTVVLDDYFLTISKIDSFTLPAFLDYKLTGEDFEYLEIRTGKEEIPPLSEMKVWVEGFPYSLLIKKNRKVNTTLSFDPEGKVFQSVQVTGTLNDWNPSATNMKFEDGLWKTELMLNPGRYEYLFVVDGKLISDPLNPETKKSPTGNQNSILNVGVSAAEPPHLHTQNSGSIIEIGIDQPLHEVFVLWENYRLDESFVRILPGSLEITLPAAARKMDRSYLRILGWNDHGPSNDLLIPIQKGRVLEDVTLLRREDKHATILYFMMVDRFMNGNPDNDDPIDDPEIAPRANYHGGDLAGIQQKIRDGYFSDLHINSIWLSPITQNPLEGFIEYPEPRRKYSGYHGYWPITLTTVDHRFGTDHELKGLVAEAHNRDMNVILDYVSNHVHEQNPLFQNNPDWATNLVLPDGSMNIRLWDEQRLTTWFDTFLPSLDFEIPEVVEIMSDSALYWIDEYNLDGFRHDATKHIPTNFWRTLTRKTKTRFPGRSIYQIGETFGSRELIASYLGSGLMDGKFDFNLYFDARSVFAGNESFLTLHHSLVESFSYFGHHSLMGNITGNHDMPRFISLAGGDLSFEENTKEAGWNREVGVGDPVGYKKLRQLLAFTMTIPGVPVIYYGDEIGLPGADDPDSRRMMKFEGLNEHEALTLETTRKLNQLRRTNMELMYGDFLLLHLSDNAYAYARSYFGNYTIVAFNKTAEQIDLNLELPARFMSDAITPNFGSGLRLEGRLLSISMKPWSFEVLN
jgi:cyclomaltodextrinase / maltogenic alpha-amylase / neopullulanase